jgi:hypothetical protein
MSKPRNRSILLLGDGALLVALAVFSLLNDVGTLASASQAGDFPWTVVGLAGTEAHLLELLLAACLIVRRQNPTRRLHLLAVTIHVVIGSFYLGYTAIFPAFAPVSVPMSVLHAVLLILQLMAVAGAPKGWRATPSEPAA